VVCTEGVVFIKDFYVFVTSAQTVAKYGDTLPAASNEAVIFWRKQHVGSYVGRRECIDSVKEMGRKRTLGWVRYMGNRF
jgi:hypothetical protein